MNYFDLKRLDLNTFENILGNVKFKSSVLGIIRCRRNTVQAALSIASVNNSS